MQKFAIQRILVVDNGYSLDQETELQMHPIAGELNRIYLFPEKDPHVKIDRKTKSN